MSNNFHHNGFQSMHYSQQQSYPQQSFPQQPFPQQQYHQQPYNQQPYNQQPYNQQSFSQQPHGVQIEMNSSPRSNDPSPSQSAAQLPSNSASPMSPRCSCGDLMSPKLLSLNDDQKAEKKCSLCKIGLSEKTEVVHSCGKHECRDYHLCDKCGDLNNELHPHMVDVPAKCSVKAMYYVYHRGQIDGPYTVEQIILLYVTRHIEDRTLYFKSAYHDESDKTKSKWYKLQCPMIELEEKALNENNYQCRRALLKKSVDANSEIKEVFPELYSHLVANVIIGRLRQADVPSAVPDDLNASTGYKLAIRFLGTILAFCMALILIAHNMVALFAGTCWYGMGLSCVYLCRLRTREHSEHHENNYKDGAVFMSVSTNMLAYSGMLYVPAGVVYFALTRLDTWDEIQSWMISYVVWALLAYVFSAVYWMGVQCHCGMSVIEDAMDLIIGVDLGDLKLAIEGKGGKAFEGTAKKKSFKALSFIIPSFCALFPAAIVGFLANFILEEKFELVCSEDMVAEHHVCFEEAYGCCDVISNHDYRNTYQFLGGLFSNIIGMWAVIRICGYLVVNAFPAFSAYAKRKA
eukprot:CAMPEP_0197027970 /NCGR_PEP_ID=MMETSP1384-20130603/7807_1 /TAXON_ID=29189 /ORGANISM="Ammonia sp." /LENGTH=573 /DNA_ID=CAMNT_0042456905 /DNA_START=44 /DNA_END=1765 /DNA_ORIENTATION=+